MAATAPVSQLLRASSARSRTPSRRSSWPRSCSTPVPRSPNGPRRRRTPSATRGSCAASRRSVVTVVPAARSPTHARAPRRRISTRGSPAANGWRARCRYRPLAAARHAGGAASSSRHHTHPPCQRCAFARSREKEAAPPPKSPRPPCVGRVARRLPHLETASTHQAGRGQSSPRPRPGDPNPRQHPGMGRTIETSSRTVGRSPKKLRAKNITHAVAIGYETRRPRRGAAGLSTDGEPRLVGRVPREGERSRSAAQWCRPGSSEVRVADRASAHPAGIGSEHGELAGGDLGELHELLDELEIERAQAA